MEVIQQEPVVANVVEDSGSNEISKQRKKRVMSEKQLEALKRGRDIANETKRAKREASKKQLEEKESEIKPADVPSEVSKLSETPTPIAVVKEEKPVATKTPRKYVRKETLPAVAKKTVKPAVKEEDDKSDTTEITIVDDDDDEDYKRMTDLEEEKYVTAMPPDYFRRVLAARKEQRQPPQIQIISFA